MRQVALLDPETLRLTTFAEFDEHETPVSVRIAPNDESIVVTIVSKRAGGRTTSVVQINSENKRRELIEDAVAVAWSPDSKRVLVRKGSKYKWTHSTIDVETLAVQRIDLPKTDAVSDWSSNPAKVCVMAGRPDRIFEQRSGEVYPRRQLYRFDLTTLVAQPPLTHASDDCIQGIFSDDGSMLAYSRRTYSAGEPVELCEVMNLRDRRTITVKDFTALGVRPNGSPCWSPDGQQLAWQVTRRVDSLLTFELWFLPIDGSPHRIVTSTELGLYFLGMTDW